MSLRRRKVHPTETYRFSITHTLSDYPLLIGEILRRNAMRAAQQAKRRTFFYGAGASVGDADTASSRKSEQWVLAIKRREKKPS
jgi:hypothetical protein